MENTKPTAEEYISQVSWQAYSTLGYDIVVDRKDALEACKLSREEVIEEIRVKINKDLMASEKDLLILNPNAKDEVAGIKYSRYTINRILTSMKGE
jgi:hypothetical protein